MSLDPKNWPADEVEQLIALSSSLRGDAASGRFGRGCVVASTSPLASYAGRKALEVGGTAVDAALATAFTQIASAAGCWVSYAGIISMVHFDASTGKTSSLSGGFRTFVDETEPESIPASPEPSGRTALVPGFFAGAWAAHQRFGRLPWADLLMPAIWVADGLPLGESLANMIATREPVLSRTPEARHALLPNGTAPKSGTPFAQAALAATLRAVAADGIDHLYRGAWAEKFVEVIRREGGKAQLADLAFYEPIWSEPTRATAFGFQVCSVGHPETAGAALIEGLKTAEALGVGDLDGDPEAVHLLVQIGRANQTLSEVPPAERVSDEHAARLAKIIRETGRAPLPSVFTPGSHSDFVVTADPEGNVAAVCHTINTAAFGNSGLFVDGISIPDAASFQQPWLAKITPGGPLPHTMNPAIVLKDGRPVLGSSSIGAGLNETTLSCVHRHLAHGVPLSVAVRGALIHGIDYGTPVSDSINNDVENEGATEDLTVLISRINREALEQATDPRDAFGLSQQRFAQSVTGAIDADAVAAAGSRVTVHADDEAAFLRGYWGGIAIDPATGALEGARTGFVNAQVEGL